MHGNKLLLEIHESIKLKVALWCSYFLIPLYYSTPHNFTTSKHISLFEITELPSTFHILINILLLQHGGHNTDGFDVSSCTGITVQNSVVKNQDDCVAVNQGSDMTFKNLTCIGGHGLSLSVGQSTEDGSPNEVSNIHFLDSRVIDSANGIHIKTHTDAGTGSVNDVSYQNIILTSK